MNFILGKDLLFGDLNAKIINITENFLNRQIQIYVILRES